MRWGRVAVGDGSIGITTGRRSAMRKRNDQGFTLIEVVVVVAVIAILAAVLTPYITKYIDDSKIAKARNEVQVVAAALTNAYKDLGRWPNRNTPVADYGGLFTGATTPAAAFFGAATGWAAPGALWTSLDTHLVTNGHTYPAAGDARWVAAALKEPRRRRPFRPLRRFVLDPVEARADVTLAANSDTIAQGPCLRLHQIQKPL